LIKYLGSKYLGSEQKLLQDFPGGVKVFTLTPNILGLWETLAQKRMHEARQTKNDKSEKSSNIKG